MNRSQTARREDAQQAIRLYGPEAYAGMRKAGRLAAETLDFITPYVRPGVSTGELDRLLEQFIRDHGAIPAPLGYRGFPKANCISINHVVCHGIPGDKRLQNGDILNIDVTPIVDGWYGDSSRMYYAGDDISLKARRLVEVTYEALMLGIAAVKPGATLGLSHGFLLGVMRWEIKVLGDGWTAVTKDKSLSAQFEHSMGVTAEGCEVFTLSPLGFTKPPYPESAG